MRVSIMIGLSLVAYAIDSNVLGDYPFGWLIIVILAAMRDLMEFKQKKQIRALQIIKLEMEIKKMI